MTAEPDAHLQHFSKSVYSQNDATADLQPLSELAWIESRSMSFARYKQGVELDGSVPAIPEGLLRHWVDADVASFRKLDQHLDIEVAADNISANHQMYADYAKEMQRLAADVSKQVADAKEANRKRGVEQDRVSAQDLVARLRDTDAQRALPLDENAVDGFSGGPSSKVDRTADPEVITRILEGITYKGRADGSVLYLLNSRAAFVDHGRQLEIDKGALQDDDAILAAVLLAKEKYGGAFTVTGCEEFKRRAMEVIARHNIAVKLKSPAQELMLAEIGAAHPGYSNRPTGSAAHQVASASEPTPPDSPVELLPAVTLTSAPTEEPVATPLAIRPILAIDWWKTQHTAIDFLAVPEVEKVSLRGELGTEPAHDEKYWFDIAGNYVPEPTVDAMRAYEIQLAAAHDQFEPSPVNEELTHERSNTVMSESDGGKEHNHPILRGLERNPASNELETSILLFKGKGDYLQGFIVQDGVKHQVLAHINERKPDVGTGELKPNFLKVSTRVGEGEKADWQELGFGNAVNKRADERPVYFDEVLFNVNGKTMGARLGKNVSPELQSKLGFASGQLERPKTERKEAAEAPKMVAPAEKVEVPPAGAPKASKARKQRA